MPLISASRAESSLTPGALAGFWRMVMTLGDSFPVRTAVALVTRYSISARASATMVVALERSAEELSLLNGAMVPSVPVISCRLETREGQAGLTDGASVLLGLLVQVAQYIQSVAGLTLHDGSREDTEKERIES